MFQRPVAGVALAVVGEQAVMELTALEVGLP